MEIAGSAGGNARAPRVRSDMMTSSPHRHCRNSETADNDPPRTGPFVGRRASARTEERDSGQRQDDDVGADSDRGEESPELEDLLGDDPVGRERQLFDVSACRDDERG
jgi:hypothetical protein